MANFPGTTPTSQAQASALLSNAAANAGLTNATPFDRLTNLEQIVANLLTGVPAAANYASTNAITAFATGGQTSAVAITTPFARITVCATIGDSVKLPLSVAGLCYTVTNSGATAADIFPFLGDLIDALAVNTAIRLAPGTTAVFSCAVAGTWNCQSTPLPYAKFTTDATGSQTLPVGYFTGAATVNATNTAAGAIAWTTRTATQMFADTPNARVGDKYLLIVSNFGNNTITITGGGGVTVTGTATIATLIVRMYIVTFTSATALVMQNIGAGAAT